MAHKGTVMKRITIALILFLLSFTPAVFAADSLTAPALDFTLHKLEAAATAPAATTQSPPTLLIIGGIQGDEPGGFNAASLVASHYTITHGNVWVVPDLNFPSIIKRSRGIHGDMNRKFAKLPSRDPEFDTVSRIKNIIVSPQVDAVLNLHDGSGFYRPTWENSQCNPNRWGQSVIIDQATLNAPRYGNLEQMGKTAVDHANDELLDGNHRYYLKNTETRRGDREMEKTLTYFAILHGKPAFGIEASKQFPTHVRAYYHLRVLESFMRQMGIQFTRNFALTRGGVYGAIERDLAVRLYDGRITLPLDDIRRTVSYIPMHKGQPVTFSPLRPLLTLLPDSNRFDVYYGNRRLTAINPQYFDYDNSLEHVALQIDGESTAAKVGDVVSVQREFMVEPIKGYRINVIGMTKKGVDDEAGLNVSKADFLPGFSIDTRESLYRVEVYRQREGKEDAFAGMLIMNFGGPTAQQQLAMENSPDDAPASLDDAESTQGR
ncbi:M99 family carboxypeptidase catalytic domain-containing protein [Oleidesulfovibrio sp.]|uniref:M14 family metallopeptidase n=1 Tax=Oleidesulfovibrio sp. TaxID=2909707 RepID=UPI003A84582D